ncbi:MAG: ComF family protein [Xanthomonadales bacterium]|nr:ComF family protein [Xanthomonadales bacterium]
MNPVDGYWRRLGLRLLPPRCLLCGAAGAMRRELCAPCTAGLPWNHHHCARCALPLAVSADHCGRCQQQLPAFDRLIAPFRYDYPLDGLIQRFKFNHDLAAGVLLADLMTDTLAARLTDPAAYPNLLVPVPLHTKRLRERGFNQSLELAKRIAPGFALGIDADALVRDRATEAQSGLAAAARRNNVRDAFRADPTRVANRHIALVDDVATTAATVNECARALRQAGANQISVWVVARAPAQRD